MARFRGVCAVALAGACAGVSLAQLTGPGALARFAPSPLEGLRYDEPFFRLPDGSLPPYDPAVPTGEAVLGFRIGERAATHAQIEALFRAWDGKGPAGEGPRARLVAHGTSWEGRSLFHLIVSSPENIARLDELRERNARLADPEGGDVDSIVPSHPAVAWMGYAIHGNETSGADGALALAYHLVAATDDATRALLRDVVVIIDPLMNPDGRDRFLGMIAEHRAANPSVDDQSLLHSGIWPFGRTNHYMFDLNRDWIFASQPETRARIPVVRAWNPQLFVDAHEMWSQDTFLFSPPREPYNPHHPAAIKRWNNVVASDHAAAFDRFGWRYYTGEWNEGWYPGYSDAWAQFRGAIGVLYEQARIAEDAVRRRDGTLEPYRLSVHKQAVSSLANLQTLARNREAILRDFARERRDAAAGRGPTGSRWWIIDAPAEAHAVRAFRDLMAVQGIEVRRTEATFRATVRGGGGAEAEREFAGAWLVEGAQPEANLAATLLSVDPRMPASFLEQERRELLRFGSSKLYDTTAWNIPMLFGLAVYEADAAPSDRGAVVGPEAPPARDDAPARAALPETTIGWAFDGVRYATDEIAARLMERGVRVRAVTKAVEAAGATAALPRGSIVALRVDNAPMGPAFDDALAAVAGERGAAPAAIPTGLGEGAENPDIGGEFFPLLVQPRIAILTRGLSDNSVGEAWFTVDQRMGVRATLLPTERLGGVDLRPYNVLIVPNSWAGDPLRGNHEAVRQWVRAGGTLIAMGSAAAALASEDPDGDPKTPPLSGARLLPAVLGDLDAYEQQALREWKGRTLEFGEPDAAAAWSAGVPAGDEIDYPWKGVEDRASKEELARRDAWHATFMPQGAIVASRTDDRHWLTLGVPATLPVLYVGDSVLMAKDGVAAPVRLGVFEPAPAKAPAEAPPAAESDAEPDEKKDPPRARRGWSAAPEGYEPRLRMSGLLWPEAAARLANTAYVTREGLGAGQVILFASSPNFRGATLGTSRLFTNAVVFGPGLGANAPVPNIP